VINFLDGRANYFVDEKHCWNTAYGSKMHRYLLPQYAYLLRILQAIDPDYEDPYRNDANTYIKFLLG
jgi:hypothetical protein